MPRGRRRVARSETLYGVKTMAQKKPIDAKEIKVAGLDKGSSSKVP